MTELLLPAFALLARTLPYRILSYYPFRDRLRFPFWVVALLIGGTEVLEMILYSLSIAVGYSGRGAELLFGPICILVYFSCIKADRFKLWFLYLFFSAYLMMTWGVSQFLELHFFTTSSLTLSSLYDICTHLTIFVITAPLIVLFLRKFKNLVFQIEAPALWRTIWLLPTFTSILVLLLTGNAQSATWRFMLARILLLLSMFVVFYILLYSLNTIRSQAALEEHNKQQEQLLILQQQQYLQLQKNIEATRAARHDLRQHLRLIQAYIEQGDQEALRDYIEAYRTSLPIDTHETYCENYAVDVLVRYYAEDAKSYNVAFTSRLNLPKILPVNEAEFCTMLGNLLENALDACRDCLKTAPYIRLNAEQVGQCISVTVDNSCLTPPRQKNDRFLSVKHSGYGTGTLSIQATATRYNGVAKFTYENNIFSASVLLMCHL